METSSHSFCSLSFNAASESADFFADNAELISSFKAFNAGPAIWRSSGDILPSSRIFKLTSPFLPTAAIRTFSKDVSSTASETAFKYLDFKAFKASMVMSLLLCNELSQQHPDASSASVKYT